MYDCNCNFLSVSVHAKFLCFCLYIFWSFLAFMVLFVQNVSWITSQVLELNTTNKDIWRNWLASCIPFSRCEYVTVEISLLICTFVWPLGLFKVVARFFVSLFCFDKFSWWKKWLMVLARDGLWSHLHFCLGYRDDQ